MMPGHLAIEGLIGAGKTTLARRIAEMTGSRLVLEEFDENPFLPKFYEQPDRFAFAVELSFLAQRYHQLKGLSEPDLFSPRTIVSDHTIGKSLVFAGVTLPPDELKLFQDLFSIMFRDLPLPDLILYLHMNVDRLQDRIKLRGRDYEQSIGLDYLRKVHERYLDHLQKLPQTKVLIADLGERDLLQEPEAFEQLWSAVLEPSDKPLRIIHL